MVEGDTICSEQREIHFLCHYLQVVLRMHIVALKNRTSGSIREYYSHGSISYNSQYEIKKLKQENDELRAELEL